MDNILDLIAKNKLTIVVKPSKEYTGGLNLVSLMELKENLTNELIELAQIGVKYHQYVEYQHGRNYDDDEAERKLNDLAERYRELEGKLRRSWASLQAASEEEECWAYNPDWDNEIESMCDDFVVKIYAGWLRDLLITAYEQGKAGKPLTYSINEE